MINQQGSGDCPPTTCGYGWRRDLFMVGITHLADLAEAPRWMGGRRRAVAVDERHVDVDAPELPGQTVRCPDCRQWARDQWGTDDPPGQS